MSARFLLSLSFIFSLSSFISPALLPALRAEHTVFIGAPGSTASASDLSNAFRQLPSGGVIILRGPVHAGANFSATPHAARVTLTSLHNGTDYRPAGARLLLGDSFVLGGPAFFDNITLAAASDSSRVFCAGQPAVFGPGVACLPAPNGKFPSLVAAARDGNLSNLAVLGGEWHSLLGGSSGSSAGNLSVTIRGGRFHGPVCAAGSGPHKGNATLAIHGGEFLGGVAVLPDTPAAALNGAASVTLNNGV
ncbi:MAG: hypothetical protein LBR12_05655, partial [Opitutaceae bacterium]|nr:hypothetical protein [Opitutaceae bacterium]